MYARGWSTSFLILILILVALAATTCRRPLRLPLDQPVQVRVTTPVRFADSDLDLYFRRVASDSRCPRNTQCVSAGEAVLALEGRILKGPVETFTARVVGAGADTDTAQATLYDGYRIWVLGLEPYPIAGVTPDTTTYVATMVVRKR